jgi:rod shape-determining protein MreD
MKPNLLQRVDVKLRQALPVLLILICILLSVAPLRLPDHALVTPGLVLVAVFYWTVHRPDLLRPWNACLLGLLDDILSGTGRGVNALVLTLVHWVVVSQHRVFLGRSFAVVWIAFALVAPLAIAAIAVMSALAARGTVDPAVVVVQSLLTIAAYPPLAWLFGRAQRLFLAAV